jgi:hypothetical protein
MAERSGQSLAHRPSATGARTETERQKDRTQLGPVLLWCATTTLEYRPFLRALAYLATTLASIEAGPSPSGLTAVTR